MNTFKPGHSPARIPQVRRQGQLTQLVETLSGHLITHDKKIVTVESCTGGQLAALFTDSPGSSEWFDRGFVTYSNSSKIEMVGVKAATLSRYGAGSEQVAAEMAQGGVANSEAKYALSITGIAGPGGGSEDKPVGMVCFGWAGFSPLPQTKLEYFQGDRQAVREQSVYFAIQEAVKQLLL
jgi:nicotinamide-nucleotide amidase